MIKIIQGTTLDIPVIQRIAEDTWWPTYSPILSAQQLRFMLDAIYSNEALQKVMESGQQIFLILHDANGPQGFASYGVRPENPTVFKLHKIYVSPGNQGKGYGNLLVQKIISTIKAPGIEALDLNVNRFNKAKTFYEKLGFTVIREEDVPIGPYWMNDFVMRLKLNQ